MPSAAVKKRRLDASIFMVEEKPARLMRHAPPFGYKFGVGPNAFSLEELYAKRRNATLPTVRHFWSCAVVGSSGNLRHHRLGPEIDAHDAVIRVNGAPLSSSYSAMVGARTTWRVFASPRAVSATKFKEEDTYPNESLIVLCNREYVYSCQHVLFADRKPRVHGLNPRFYESVQRQVHGKRHRHAPVVKVPLTGIVAVAVAMKSCDAVNVYGLSTMNWAARPSCLYYWLCGSKGDNATDARYHDRRMGLSAWFARHDFSLNAQALLGWNASGVIRLRT